jgi:hypothetical protein
VTRFYLGVRFGCSAVVFFNGQDAVGPTAKMVVLGYLIVENMEQRTLERIRQEFQEPDQDGVIKLLTSYSGPESDRVRWDILELSKGELGKIGGYVKAAQTDYRDILYWAQYYKNDPLLRVRDPKQMVEEIIAKWGKKNE